VPRSAPRAAVRRRGLRRAGMPCRQLSSHQGRRRRRRYCSQAIRVPFVGLTSTCQLRLPQSHRDRSGGLSRGQARRAGGRGCFEAALPSAASVCARVPARRRGSRERPRSRKDPNAERATAASARPMACGRRAGNPGASPQKPSAALPNVASTCAQPSQLARGCTPARSRPTSPWGRRCCRRCRPCRRRARRRARCSR